jgi:GT2 family glycosyltransferase
MEASRSYTYPFVSIIILTYNGKRFIDECLNSIKNIDYPREQIEIIIADNGSIDGTPRYVHEKHPYVKLVRFKKNYGFALGNNKAAKYAKGKYIAFLNQDVIVDKKWLIEMIRLMERDDKIALCGSQVRDYYNRNEIQSLGQFITTAGEGFNITSTDIQVVRTQMRNFAYVTSVMGCSMLIRRDIFFAVGGFDENYFMYDEELDLGFRLWLKGYKVAVVLSSLVYHYLGGGLLSEFQTYWHHRNRLGTIVKNFEKINVMKGLFIAFIADLAKSILFIKHKKPGLIIKMLHGNLDALKDLRLHLNKRKAIQQNRRYSDKELKELNIIAPTIQAIKIFLKRMQKK